MITSLINPPALDPTTKVCSQCGEELSLSLFHKNGSRYYSLCKLCKGLKYNILSNMLASSKGRAKRKGWDFDLDAIYLMRLRDQQLNRCALTGIPLNWKYEGPSKQRICPPDRASLDRIDPTQGYIKGNVQLVTDLANRIKAYHSPDTFIDFCRRVVINNPEN